MAVISRRKLLAGGAAATAWPAAVHAQQSAIPVIGFLGGASPETFADRIQAFQEGLREAGFFDGRNVLTEYRWAEFQNDRLPALAADLVRRRVAVIVTFAGTPPALAAKSATSTIPIVVGGLGVDPVKAGLVSSLNHPAGNVTGVASLGIELAPKRLELLHEVVPASSSIALLVNPSNPDADAQVHALGAAAQNLDLSLDIVRATKTEELEEAFTTAVQHGAKGLVITPDPFLNSHREQLGVLAAEHRLPTIFQFREFAAVGGLMSYGGNLSDGWRLVGVYAGRILKGEKPADLPVQQSTKVELILNLKAAKALGLTVPLSLLGRADEVIE
jgi:putative tryptophan/tyrosine transport system substrate-binding protein